MTPGGLTGLPPCDWGPRPDQSPIHLLQAIAGLRLTGRVGPPGVMGARESHVRSGWPALRSIATTTVTLAVSAMKDVFRRPVASRRIDSPTFCHGVAGLMAIAMRFANDTGLPEFVEESRTLARTTPG